MRAASPYEATSVTPAVLLADHLKALKLPTFAREYDKMRAKGRTAHPPLLPALMARIIAA